MTLEVFLANEFFYFLLFVHCDYFHWGLTPDLLCKPFLVGPPTHWILWGTFFDSMCLIGLLFRRVCFIPNPNVTIVALVSPLSSQDYHFQIWVKTIVLNKFPWPTVLMPQWAQVNTINWRMISKELNQWKNYKNRQMKVFIIKTRVLLKPEYSRQTRPIYCYWYHGFLHHQVISNNGIDSMNGNFSCTKKEFISLCHVSVEKW